MCDEADFFAVKPEQGSLFTDAKPFPDKALGPLYQRGQEGKLFCVVCGVALDAMHTYVCGGRCRNRARQRNLDIYKGGDK